MSTRSRRVMLLTLYGSWTAQRKGLFPLLFSSWCCGYAADSCSKLSLQPSCIWSEGGAISYCIYCSSEFVDNFVEQFSWSIPWCGPVLIPFDHHGITSTKILKLSSSFLNWFDDSNSNSYKSYHSSGSVWFEEIASFLKLYLREQPSCRASRATSRKTLPPSKERELEQDESRECLFLLIQFPWINGTTSLTWITKKGKQLS